MGWNTGWTIIEQQVVSVYDVGALTTEILKLLLLPFKDTDIDEGGSADLRTKDGKSFTQIVIKMLATDEAKAQLAQAQKAVQDAGATYERLWPDYGNAIETFGSETAHNAAKALYYRLQNVEAETFDEAVDW